jgi:hypothetical protein
MMSWGTALVWGTVIIAVLFGVLFAANLAFQYFMPIRS